MDDGMQSADLQYGHADEEKPSGSNEKEVSRAYENTYGDS